MFQVTKFVRRIVVIFLCIFLTVLAYADDQTEQQKALGIFNKSIELSTSKKTGVLTIRQVFVSNFTSRKPLEQEYEIVFDNSKTMIVRKEKEKDRTVIFGQGILPVPEALVYFRTHPSSIVGKPPENKFGLNEFRFDLLTFYPKGSELSLKRERDTQEFSFPDLTLFGQWGQLPCELHETYGYSLQTLLAGLSQKMLSKEQWESPSIEDEGCYNPVVSEEIIDSVKCYKISWGNLSRIDRSQIIYNEKDQPASEKEKDLFWSKSKERFLYSIWMVPEQNFLVRKIERQSVPVNVTDTNDPFYNNWHSITTNKARKDDISGLWYPFYWVHECKLNGNFYTKDEVWMDVKNGYNQKLDSRLFLLEQRNEIEPLCPIAWELNTPQPVKGSMIWDGKKIIGKDDQMPDENVMSRKYFRFLFVLFVNIALISGLFLSLYIRKFRRNII